MMTSVNSNTLPNGSTTITSRSKSFLGEVNRNNIGQLKTLNSLMFPVSYSPAFYQAVLSSGDFAKLCYYHDICVGAVCCRKDDFEKDTTLKEKEFSCYIMTLGVLAAYRKLGLGSLMLEHILELCKKDSSVKKVYLHVQTNNEPALKFYEKYGFEKAGIVNEYYKNIKPSDAHLLVLNLK